MPEPTPTSDWEPPLVELDDDRRGELDLSGLGNPAHRRYRVFEQPNGMIELRPERTDEELEERLLADPKIMASIQEAREHPEHLVPRSELDRP